MKELVHLDNGKVSFSLAVTRVAESLNPLYAARDITAIIGACVVEIAQLELEEKRLKIQGEALSEHLKRRRYEIASIFEIQKIRAADIRVSRKSIRKALNSSVQQSTDRHISEDERLMHMGLIPVLSGQLVTAISQEGDELIRLVTALNLGTYERRIEGWQ